MGNRQESNSSIQTILLVAFFVVLFSLTFLWGTFNETSIKMIVGLIGIIFFFISFFHIKAGLILLAVAMLFSPEFSVGSIGIRPITIRADDVLIPVLVVALLARAAIKRETRLLVQSPLNRPIFLLLTLSIVSTLRGMTTGAVYSPLMALFLILKTTEFFIIFFMILGYVRTEKDIKTFLVFSLAVVGLVGIYTIFQIPRVEIFTENRITAPFEGSPEPATVGGYMAFLLLILLSIFLYEKRPGMKWFYGILGTIIFIPFLFTLNRTSYAALLIGTFYIAWVVKNKGLTFLLLALLLASPLLAPRAVKERIAFTWEDAKNPGRNLNVDYSFQERIYAYRKMWNLAKSSILIGWGVSSWDIVDSQYARTIQEIGIIGLGFWLWIFMRLFRISKWLFHSLEDGLFKGMALGYRAGLIGLLMHCFGAATFYIVRIMEPFWFISGLVVSLYLLRVNQALPVDK